MAAARGTKEAPPPEQIAELARSLASALPRAVIIRGDERWFREEALRVAIDAAAKRGFEIVRHAAKDPDFRLQSLLDDLSAPPMFASARCVVVRDAASLLKKEEGVETPLSRVASAFLADRARAGILVLDAEGLRADHALVKRAREQDAPVLDLRRLYATPAPWERDPDPRRTELVRWLVARARERNVALTPDEAVYVAQATGNDLAGLDTALTRLATRDPRSNVRALVAWEDGASPFDVAEHLARGDLARSLAGIEALFRAGFQEKDGDRSVDRGAIVAMLFNALRMKARQALVGAAVIEARGDVAQAADAAGVSSQPRARTEFEARVRTRDAHGWRVFLDDVTALERGTRLAQEQTARGDADASAFAAFALRSRERRPVR